MTVDSSPVKFTKARSTGKFRSWSRAHPTPQPGERDGSGTDIFSMG
jgi:hypothetical protein